MLSGSEAEDVVLVMEDSVACAADGTVAVVAVVAAVGVVVVVGVVEVDMLVAALLLWVVVLATVSVAVA